MLQKTIWLDGRNITRAEGTGVYRYASDLFKTIKKINYSPSWLLEETQTTLSSRKTFLRFIQAILAFPPYITPNSFTSPWGKAYLGRDLYRVAHIHYKYHHRLLRLKPATPPAIMHWTYPLPILIEGSQNIVTIHDLIPLTHPHLTGINSEIYKQLIRDLIKENTHFITVSESVRQDLLKYFSLPAENITTLYQTIDIDETLLEAMTTAPQIAPAHSFLFYGRIEHRKNLEALLEAHALSQSKTPLVIIGPAGEDAPDCSPRSSTSKIIRLPWSERLSLLRTLSEAKALLFPSLAEGFGIPIIEAMTLGIPVLTSKGGATEEIAGNAALLCSPDDIPSLASAISYLDHLSAEERTKYANKGKRRASDFNAETYAQKLKIFYDSFFLNKKEIERIS